MAELTVAKIERIDRALLSKERKRLQDRAQLRKLDGLLVLMIAGFTGIIMGAVLLMHAQWSPGSQDDVAKRYRASRHDAVEVAWK
jgi:hypothetical protein